MSTLAALITTHNRREVTLQSLDALFTSLARVNDVQAFVFLVDAGSTDGTPESVRNHFPSVEVIPVGSEIFWNRGMAIAFDHAVKRDFDFYLLLNDDTFLDANAVGRMLAESTSWRVGHGIDAVMVGSTNDPDSGKVTYGGLVRESRHSLRFEPIAPPNKPTAVDTMNCNCVLVPRPVVAEVGVFDHYFSHNWGDIDYGLRVNIHGFDVVVVPGFVGTCAANSVEGTWQDAEVGIVSRFRMMAGPKGMPFSERRHFVRKHCGALWPYFLFRPYLGIVVTSCRRLIIRTIGRPRSTITNA